MYATVHFVETDCMTGYLRMITRAICPACTKNVDTTTRFLWNKEEDNNDDDDDDDEVGTDIFATTTATQGTDSPEIHNYGEYIPYGSQEQRFSSARGPK